MYQCKVLPGKTPKIFEEPTNKSRSFGYLGSGSQFRATEKKSDVIDPSRAGTQVWLKMEDGRWTFAEYPHMDGSPEYFISYTEIEDAPTEPDPKPEPGEEIVYLIGYNKDKQPVATFDKRV